VIVPIRGRPTRQSTSANCAYRSVEVKSGETDSASFTVANTAIGKAVRRLNVRGCPTDLIERRVRRARARHLPQSTRRPTCYSRSDDGSEMPTRHSFSVMRPSMEAQLSPRCVTGEPWMLRLLCAASGQTRRDGNHLMEEIARDLTLCSRVGEQIRQAIGEYLWITARQLGQFLFAGRRGPDSGLTTRQYSRLIGEWVHRPRPTEVRYALASPNHADLSTDRQSACRYNCFSATPRSRAPFATLVSR
jgi:hypothetical protein